MGHTHSQDRTTYYVEQLCTLGICGMLGGVTVMMYCQNILRYILADYLHIYVLCSGIALLGIVGLRAIGLWRSAAGSAANHHHLEHDHSHGHDHDHEHFHGHHHDQDEYSHAMSAEPSVHAHADDELCCEHVHDHDHGHDHSWNPGRYIVLLLPIVLYFLHLPNAGFSASGVSINASELDQEAAGKYVENTGLQIAKDTASSLIQVVSVVADGPAAKAGVKAHDLILQAVREKDDEGKPLGAPDIIAMKGLTVEEAAKKLQGRPGSRVKLTIQREAESEQQVEITRAADVTPLEFNELQRAAYTPLSRQYFEGRIVQLVGQYAPGSSERTFGLVRFKITCCAADARQLDVVIMLDPQALGNFAHIKALQWVKVTGRVTFWKRKDRDEYATVLVVASPNDVKSTDPDPRPYIQ